MRTKFIIVTMILSLFLIFQATPVNAETRKVFDDPQVVDGSNVDASCNGIFTPEALELIDEVLNYFRILAPVVLILMIGVDFASAVMGSDSGGKEDAMKKAISRATRRGIAAVLLFLIPTIVKVLLSLDGIKGTIVSDPNCGLKTNKEEVIALEV